MKDVANLPLTANKQPQRHPDRPEITPPVKPDKPATFPPDKPSIVPPEEPPTKQPQKPEVTPVREPPTKQPQQPEIEPGKQDDQLRGLARPSEELRIRSYELQRPVLNE